MSISEARSIAERYEKHQADFQDRHEMLSRIFKGTQIVKPMNALLQYAAHAALLNRDAGWLPKEESTLTAREYFVACIKRDQVEEVVRSLADVPEELWSDYVNWDEQRFQKYLKSLREAYRRAHEEMQSLCSGLVRVQITGGSDFFIGLCGLVDDESEDERAVDQLKRFENLFFNLEAEWLSYTELGFSLVQMANELPESAWQRSRNAEWQLYVDTIGALMVGDARDEGAG